MVRVVYSKEHFALAGPRGQGLEGSSGTGDQVATAAPLTSPRGPRHEHVLSAMAFQPPRAPPPQRDLRQLERVDLDLGQAGADSTADHAVEMVIPLGGTSLSIASDILPNPERQALGSDVGELVAVPMNQVPLGSGLSLGAVGPGFDALEARPVVV